MKRTIWYGLLLLCCVPLLGTNYYLSGNGNDNFNGTSPATAWRSVSKLNAEANNITAGDSVFFRRGDTFFGQIEFRNSGTTNNPIVLTAYGQGPQPIISGSQAITNWTQQANSPLWYATIPWDTVAYLLKDEQFQTLARYPNQGYLLMTGGNKNHLLTNALGQPANYWQGATVRMRTSRWTYENREIVSNNALGRLNFDKATRYTAAPNWGFFIDNHFPELDMPGEWYFDGQLDRIYYYPPGNQNPNQMDLRGINYPYGLYRKGNKPLAHLVFSQLTFAEQMIEGLRIANAASNNIQIEDCQFFRQGETGLFIMGDGMELSQCYFADQLGRGVKGNYLDNGQFSDNQMKRIGLIEGYGYDGNQNMNAFHFTNSVNLNISHNQIDSVGYTGITCYIAYSTVEKNHIRYTNLRLDDGAGIYANGVQSHHTLIKDNIVEHAIGYPVGTKNPTKATSHGIYMDEGVTHNTLINNTVYDVATSGIFVNTRNHDMVVSDNFIMNFGRRGIQVLETDTANTTYNNVFTNNIIYSFKKGVFPVTIFSLFGTELAVADFQQNYLFNPYDEYVLRRGSYTTQRSYTLEEWESGSPGQANGNYETPFKFMPYRIDNDLSSNLIQNGQFTNNTNGWNYTQNANVTAGRITNGGLDGGAFRLKLNNNGATNGVLEQNLSQNLSQGTAYQVTYSVRSAGYGTMEILLRNGSNNQFGKEVMPFTPGRREQTVMIEATGNVTNPKLTFRLTFSTGTEFILDNVEIKAIDISPQAPEERVVRFTNYSPTQYTFPLTGDFFDKQASLVQNTFSAAAYDSDLLFKSDSAQVAFGPELLYFYGLYEGEQIHLHWKSELQDPQLSFELEKAGADGQFTYWNEQAAQLGTHLYQLTDAAPLPQQTFYRIWLKQVDGSREPLATIEVNYGGTGKPRLQLYPNPITTEPLQVHFEYFEPDRLPLLELLDVNGRTVDQFQPTALHDFWSLPSHLPAGYYMVRTVYGNQRHYQALIKR